LDIQSAIGRFLLSIRRYGRSRKFPLPHFRFAKPATRSRCWQLKLQDQRVRLAAVFGPVVLNAESADMKSLCVGTEAGSPPLTSLAVQLTCPSCYFEAVYPPGEIRLGDIDTDQ
jgi:hypothetical protein